MDTWSVVVAGIVSPLVAELVKAQLVAQLVQEAQLAVEVLVVLETPDPF